MDPREQVVEAARGLLDLLCTGSEPHDYDAIDKACRKLRAALKAHDAAQAKAGEGVPVAWRITNPRMSGALLKRSEADARYAATMDGDVITPLYVTPPGAAQVAVAEEAVRLARDTGMTTDEIIARAVAAGGVK